MPRALGAALALAAAALLLVPAGGALASHVDCGDVITQDTTLDSDLIDCPGDGIVIGAAGITLDLDGHLVDGDGVHGDDRCEAGIRNVSVCQGRAPGHDDVTIRDGTVREFRAGVHADGVTRNAARGLTVTGTELGIDMRHSADVVIESSLLVGNEYGIVLNEATGARVERNTCSDNSAGCLYTIDADASRILRNRAVGNGEGFRLVSGEDGVVARNRVEDNGGIGMTVEDGVLRNRILRNRVRRNGHAGIVVFEGTHFNRIEDNVVSDNGNASEPHYFDGGILVDGDNHVEQNLVSGNSRGIVLEEGEGDRVERNRVVANRGDGISGGNNAVIARNVVSRNGHDGIGGFARSRVTDNVVSRNGFMGVSPTGGDNSIERNLITGNWYGIWLDEVVVQGNEVLDNRVSANREAGIYLLEHADSNLVRGNAVSRNGGAGILVGDVRDSRIERNSVTANGLDGILVEALGPDEQGPLGHTVSHNLAAGNGDDGIDVENTQTAITANVARTNADLGIEAVAGVTDGGANRAFGNGNPLQCLNVACR